MILGTPGKSCLLITTLLAMTVTAHSSFNAAAQTPEQTELIKKNPAWTVQAYALSGQWGKLDDFIEQLAASGERQDDGRFQLYLVAAEVLPILLTRDREDDAKLAQRIEDYKSAVPTSAFAPILAAMQKNAAAWRARGNGFNSTVTPEGWQLFRERNAQAWQLIQAAKTKSARLPMWYEQALSIGDDANVSSDELTAIFNEGISRFPGYHSIYFTYARQFAPRWGGSFEEADAFINSQVASKLNKDGEALYARLYWLLDQNEARGPEFFRESRVDWQRMRQGFELLMKEFPKSKWNQANLVAFACRAGDEGTYIKWRKTVDVGEFRRAAPSGISLEVCDARFVKKT